MDQHYARRPIAGWYMIGAIASFALMALGCVALVMHLTADPAKLPLDQRQLFLAEPQWVLAASAFGFVAGALGGLLLLLRSKAAERTLLASLLGMVLWFGGMLLTPSFRDLLSTSQIALALVVVALTWTIYWFARHSRQRGWLR